MNAVDTNVVVYYMDPSDLGKSAVARDIFRSDADIVLPWQILCEVGNCLAKLEARGLPRREGRAILREMRACFPVLLPTAVVLERALDIQERYRLSFWDSNLVAACVVGGVRILYSEDITGARAIDGVRLVDPFAAEARR